MRGTCSVVGIAGSIVAARDGRGFGRLCAGPLSRLALLGVLCALLSGCYTGLQPYVAPRARVPSTDHALIVRAIVEEVTTRGLRVVRADVEHGIVVAVSPSENMGGVAIREHWRFDVTDNHIAAVLHPESREQDGWHPVNDVCESYSYSRERETLHAIRRLVRTRDLMGEAHPTAAMITAMNE